MSAPVSPFPEGDPTEDFNIYYLEVRYPESMGPEIAGSTLAFSPACRRDAEESWAGVVSYYGAENVSLVSVPGTRIAP